VEGEYVYLKEGVDGAHTFELLDGINPVPHADRVLKLGSYFVQVSKYIDTHQAFECGRVNHALCAAMNSLIKDYLIFVTQLEQKCRQGNFTLQQLLLFIQPSLHIMTTLREITREAAALKVRGGALINTIHLRALRTAGFV
jgi:gamma-tubulin complex component 2